MEGEEHYLKAGRIAAEVMEKGLGKIKEGAKLLDLAEYVEGAIIEKGGKLAFPVNISLNDHAAHYSPDAWDETVFNDSDLVKLDLGVHVEGHIADTARSVFVGEGEPKIIDAAEAALEVGRGHHPVLPVLRRAVLGLEEPRHHVGVLVHGARIQVQGVQVEDPFISLVGAVQDPLPIAGE